MIKYLILLTVILSCGKVEDPRLYNTSNEEFDSYKSLFQEEHLNYRGYKTNLGNININFYDTTDDIVGKCIKYNFHKEILIDFKYWNEHKDDLAQREILIFHELGHCVLNLTHQEGGYSIMGMNIPFSLFYTNNRETFLFNLFN